MNDLSEKTIIEAICDGDHEQYRHIVERYHRGLVQHLGNMLHDTDAAEDIAQDAFIKAFEKIRQYDDAYAFSTWLYRIADRLAYRQFKQAGRTMALDDVEEFIADDTTSAPDMMNHSMNQQTIRLAVQSMNLNYQRVITMYYWDNRSYEEIAEIMNRPIGTVRTWLRRAKEDLRKELYGRV